MMLVVLFIVFVVVPLLELYVIIQVGQEIGALPTIVLLVAAAILGSALLRLQGRAAWRRFNVAVREGRVPTNEVLDGVLVVLGGAFLLAPGFLSDVVGILLLLPPTRAIVRRLALANVAARMAASATSWGLGRATGAAQRRREGRDYDVDGTASEKPQERLQ